MYKFIKIKDPNSDYDNTEIEFKVETSSRSDLLEEFGNFLKACGFHIDGTIDIIQDD